MIPPLFQNPGLFQPSQLAQLGGGQKAAEAAANGSGNGSGANSTALSSPATLSAFPSYLGNQINTLA